MISKLLKRQLFIAVCGSLLALNSAPGSSPEKPLRTLPELSIEAEDKRYGESDPLSSESSERVLISPLMGDSPEKALRSVPAVVSPLQSKSGAPQFLLRGADAFQTRFFLEGVPLTDPAFNSNPVAVIPLIGLEAVQVYPGEVPEHLPGNSLSGAIDFRLPSGVEKNNFLARWGSFGFFEVAGKSRLGKEAQLIAGFSQGSENFTFLDDNGTPFNSLDDSEKDRVHNGFRRVTLLPLWEPSFSATSHWKIFSLNSLQLLELPGAIQKPEFHDLTEYLNVSAVQGRVALSDSLEGEGLVFLRLHTDELKNLTSMRRSPTKASSATRSMDYTLGTQGGISWRQDRYEAAFNVSLLYSAGSGATLSSASSSQVQIIEVPSAVAFKASLSKKLLFKPALVTSWSQWGLAPQIKKEWNISPRVGWEYQINSRFQIHGLIGKFFRIPNLTEMFGNQKGLWGNADLLPEKAYRAELGLDWATNPHLSLTLFAAEAHQLIQYFPSGPNSQRPENIGRARWWGQELSAEFVLPQQITVRPAVVTLFSINQSEVVAEKNKQLPQRFPWIVRLDSQWEGNKWAIGHRASWYSNSYLDRTNLQKLGGYQLHDVFISHTEKKLGHFALELQNLFNITVASASISGVESMQSIGGVLGYPVAGRRVQFSWLYDF